jgi:hypothetical protein
MKRATMVFLLSVPFLTVHHTAIAQEPLTTASTQSDSSSAAHSDEWKIKNALSAGPDFVTEKATVMDWPKPGETMWDYSPAGQQRLDLYARQTRKARSRSGVRG